MRKASRSTGSAPKLPATNKPQGTERAKSDSSAPTSSKVSRPGSSLSKAKSNDDLLAGGPPASNGVKAKKSSAASNPSSSAAMSGSDSKARSNTGNSSSTKRSGSSGTKEAGSSRERVRERSRLNASKKNTEFRS